MKRYVAMLTAVFLLALAATAQTKAELKPRPPPNFGSAHGACGPGHPYIMRQGFTINDFAAPGNPGETLAGLTEWGAMVLIGRPSGFTTRVTRYGLVEHTATFPHPLILKARPSGPAAGAANVKVEFAGGTALVGGVCTEDLGREGGSTPMYVGHLYLVFVPYDSEAHAYGVGLAYPVNESTRQIVVPEGRPGLLLRAGEPRGLNAVIGPIRAEAARERSAAGKGAQQ